MSGGEDMRGPKRKTHAEFVAQIKDRPFNVIGRYADAFKKIRFACHADDAHVWCASPHGILCGSGCPLCGAKKRLKTNNILRDHGDWLLIDISTPAHPAATCKIDKDVFDRIPGRISTAKSGYPVAYMAGKPTRIHRLINPEWKQTDHINRDKTDNRRSNLRECTTAQNAMNSSLRRTNTSGVTGVSWHKGAGKWRARIMIDGKHMHIGYFSDKADAIAARRAAEIKYFEEFAPTERTEGEK